MSEEIPLQDLPTGEQDRLMIKPGVPFPVKRFIYCLFLLAICSASIALSGIIMDKINNSPSLKDPAEIHSMGLILTSIVGTVIFGIVALLMIFTNFGRKLGSRLLSVMMFGFLCAMFAFSVIIFISLTNSESSSKDKNDVMMLLSYSMLGYLGLATFFGMSIYMSSRCKK